MAENCVAYIINRKMISEEEEKKQLLLLSKIMHRHFAWALFSKKIKSLLYEISTEKWKILKKIFVLRHVFLIWSSTRTHKKRCNNGNSKCPLSSTFEPRGLIHLNNVDPPFTKLGRKNIICQGRQYPRNSSFFPFDPQLLRNLIKND